MLRPDMFRCVWHHLTCLTKKTIGSFSKIYDKGLKNYDWLSHIQATTLLVEIQSYILLSCKAFLELKFVLVRCPGLSYIGMVKLAVTLVKSVETFDKSDSFKKQLG